MHKIGLMLRDNAHYCKVVLKTVQETEESGAINGNHWGIGEFGENSGEIGGKLKNCIPQLGNRALMLSISPPLIKVNNGLKVKG